MIITTVTRVENDESQCTRERGCVLDCVANVGPHVNNHAVGLRQDRDVVAHAVGKFDDDASRAVAIRFRAYARNASKLHTCRSFYVRA